MRKVNLIATVDDTTTMRILEWHFSNEKKNLGKRSVIFDKTNKTIRIFSITLLNESK